LQGCGTSAGETKSKIEIDLDEEEKGESEKLGTSEKKGADDVCEKRNTSQRKRNVKGTKSPERFRRTR